MSLASLKNKNSTKSKNHPLISILRRRMTFSSILTVIKRLDLTFQKIKKLKKLSYPSFMKIQPKPKNIQVL